MDSAMVKVQKNPPLVPGRVDALRISVGWEPRGNEKVAKLLRASFVYFGAFSDSELVGFIRAISDGIDDAFICDFMVHPSWQSRGVGRHLLELLIDELESLSIQFIYVTWDNRDSRLRRLYGKVGFWDMSAGIKVSRGSSES